MTTTLQSLTITRAGCLVVHLLDWFRSIDDAESAAARLLRTKQALSWFEYDCIVAANEDMCDEPQFEISPPSWERGS